MGGKKKTKWRKLPLEEFTNDCSKLKRRRSSEETKSDCARKEEKDAQNTPCPETVEENSLTFNNECVENADGIWYPTHYLVYNPVPVYPPNYMMPPNCYYYPSNEMNSASEYTGVPYQEYVPPIKDTVYLLFPASALRPTQYSSHDWRNRRRRYNGYAEYAVIPGKTNIDDKHSGKKENSSTPSKNYTSTSQFEKNIEISEKNGIEVLQHTAQKQDNQSTDHKLNGSCGLIKKMGLSKSERNEESSNKQKKIVDVCDVHSKASKQDSKSNLNNKELTKNDCDLQDSSSVKTFEANSVKQESDKESRLESNSSGEFHQHIETQLDERVFQYRIKNTNDNPLKNDIDTSSFMRNNPIKMFSDGVASSKDENKMKSSANEESKSFPNPSETYVSDTSCENAESDQNNFNRSSLPDVITTGNKTIAPNIDENTDSPSLLNNDRTQIFSSLHSTKDINESVSKIPSVSATRSAYLPYLYNTNSDLGSENKITDKKSSKFPPVPTNSIYKLAFDESLPDQSGTESRSPSPIERCPIDRSQIERSPVDQSPIERCPVYQSPIDEDWFDIGSIDAKFHVPSNLMNNEINIYEADSDDDAGSEDLELIPHRYESESFLNKSKHLYENKLSLAVELLRTKESLPYDAQFKRVIEDSQEYPKTGNSRAGEVNMGFVDDLNSLDSIELKSENFTSHKSDDKTITKQCKTHKQISSNSISYDISLDDSLTNSYELADEAIAQSANHQGNREELNAGYRRIGHQFRHYFSPSSTLVNPWNCCIIM